MLVHVAPSYMPVHARRYVVVLFEGIVARTCTIDDDLDPKWHAEAPRAFCALPAHRIAFLVWV